ncbi:DinB family protein [Cyanobium sp. ATX-6F1]|uniref:DinB family protein n=1 Tax=Cyanobium sp. ATX-6F1 TaxID=3137388 RepID=UPI0039BE4179
MARLTSLQSRCPGGESPDTAALAHRLGSIRRQSEALIAGLQPEDLCLQGMADASPPKWHLGHTGWFFETFLLATELPEHEPADSRWGYLFNSYYDTVGERLARPLRGLLTRPTIAEVLAWRQRVDASLVLLIERLDQRPPPSAAPRWPCWSWVFSTNNSTRNCC